MSDDPFPAFKGRAFKSYVETLGGLADAKSYEHFLDALPADGRALLTAPPHDSEWLSDTILDAILRQGFVALKNDPVQMKEYGRRAFSRDVRTVYRIFIRALSPKTVAQSAPGIYKTTARNNATLRCELRDGNEFLLHYLNVPVPSEGFWNFMRGIVTAFVEATGVRNVRVEMASGGGESADGSFIVTWD
jgi:hypothetical protein